MRVEVGARGVEHERAPGSAMFLDDGEQFRIRSALHGLLGELLRISRERLTLHPGEVVQERALRGDGADDAQRFQNGDRREGEMHRRAPALLLQHEITEQRLRVERQQRVIEVEEGESHFAKSSPRLICSAYQEQSHATYPIIETKARSAQIFPSLLRAANPNASESIVPRMGAWDLLIRRRGSINRSIKIPTQLAIMRKTERQAANSKHPCVGTFFSGCGGCGITKYC